MVPGLMSALLIMALAAGAILLFLALLVGRYWASKKAVPGAAGGPVRDTPKKRRKKQDRLTTLLYLSSGPAFCGAALFAWGLLYELYDQSQNLTQWAYEPYGAILAAIRRDDVEDFEQTRALCLKSWRCQIWSDLSTETLLWDALDHHSHQVMALLVAQGARVTPRGPPTSLAWDPTPEDRDSRYDALGKAILNQDLPMVRLLLPVSDSSSRKIAIWTAAAKDDLDIVKALAAEQVPLTLPGESGDLQHGPLLVAAAAGLALNVGRWLIEEQHVSAEETVDGLAPSTLNGWSPNVTPISPLQGLVGNFYSDRKYAEKDETAFLKLLLTHGAKLDTPLWGGKTAAQWVIDDCLMRGARDLLNAAGSRPQLTPEQKTTLADMTSPEYKQTPEYAARCGGKLWNSGEF